MRQLDRAEVSRHWAKLDGRKHSRSYAKKQHSQEKDAGRLQQRAVYADAVFPVSP